MFDQKTLDWANLVQCLLIVYGGRIFAIRSNPRVKATKQPTPPHAAQAFNPAPPPVYQTPSPRMNGDSASAATNVGEIAGVGSVELPDDHPLSPNFKPTWNN